MGISGFFLVNWTIIASFFLPYCRIFSSKHLPQAFIIPFSARVAGNRQTPDVST
jgi:hypothetical protein